MDDNKKKIRQKIDHVRKILLKDWDPVCVGDNPNLTDEYDYFLAPLIRLLDNNGTYDEFYACLLSMEEKELGGKFLDSNREKAARALCNIDLKV